MMPRPGASWKSILRYGSPILPGFSKFRGSRADLTSSCRWKAPSPTASRNHLAFARPMPCSPVMVPPCSSTQRNSLSTQASARAFFWVRVIVHHDVGVNVAVSGMAEACDVQPRFPVHGLAEFHQVHQAGPGDDDVFIQLGHAGGFQAVGKFTPQLPNGFRLLFRVRAQDVGCAAFFQQGAEGIQFFPHGGLPAVHFHNQVAAAAGGQGAVPR